MATVVIPNLGPVDSHFLEPPILLFWILGTLGISVECNKLNFTQWEFTKFFRPIVVRNVYFLHYHINHLNCLPVCPSVGRKKRFDRQRSRKWEEKSVEGHTHNWCKRTYTDSCTEDTNIGNPILRLAYRKRFLTLIKIINPEAMDFNLIPPKRLYSHQLMRGVNNLLE